MITAVEFDFENKRERAIGPQEIPAALASGHYCWIDVLVDSEAGQAVDRQAAADCLEGLGMNELARSEVMGPEREGRYDVYEDCLHFAVTEAKLISGSLRTAHVDVVLGTRFLLTYRQQASDLVSQMRRIYREDFRKFAQSPGFLLYEIADHLAETYRRSLQGLATSVEGVQLQLYGEVDDSIFQRVSTMMQDLLILRKVVTASREIFNQLATRRSPFVSESTRPFLENMAGTLARLSDDLTTEREVLNEMLNLYMGMVSHRTNKIINRLTVISVIFLPLSFLCGVYGINMQGVPEFSWKYGYLFFWAIIFLTAAGLVIYMRRRKWL